MQLRDNHALGSVDGERTVLGHQRNFPEEDFLFFDVANRLGACFGVFIENRQPDRDFERGRVGHATLLTLGHIIFQLQSHRVAAAVTKGDDVLVKRSAAVAKHVADMERIGLDSGAATGVAAGRAQVVQSFQIAALTLPISYGVVDEFELAESPEVRNRKDRVKYALQTGVFPFAGKQIHLQKALI